MILLSKYDEGSPAPRLGLTLALTKSSIALILFEISAMEVSRHFAICAASSGFGLL